MNSEDEILLKLQYNLHYEYLYAGGPGYIVWDGDMPPDFLVMCGYAYKSAIGYLWHEGFINRCKFNTPVAYREFQLNLLAYKRIYG